MKNFLEKLRKKDDAQKVVLSFFTAIVLTFVIASSWLTWTLAKDDEKQENKDEKSEEVTPLSNLGSQAGELKEMFGNMMSEYKESKEIIKSLPEVIQQTTATTTGTSPATSTTVTTTTNSTTTSQIESSNE